MTKSVKFSVVTKRLGGKTNVVVVGGGMGEAGVAGMFLHLLTKLFCTIRNCTWPMRAKSKYSQFGRKVNHKKTNKYSTL